MTSVKDSLTVLSKKDKKIIKKYSNIEITELSNILINETEKINYQTKNLK